MPRAGNRLAGRTPGLRWARRAVAVQTDLVNRADRRTRRLLRQMDRAAASARRPRRRPGGILAGLVIALAFTLAGAAVLATVGWDPADLLRPRAYIDVEGRAVAIPRPEPSDGRLAEEVPVTTQGEHAFLHTDDAGGPVGYDPCRPVHYVIRPDGAPEHADALLAEATAIIADATGLVLQYAGETDEAPSVDRPLIQPERYGDGWAPLLVAWSDPSEMPELAGEVAGVGGSAAVPGANGTGLWLVAGRVVFDAPDLAELMRRENGYGQARAIVIHELAHALGLDHVADPGELMHPVTSNRLDLGPGDRQGLALVGQVACQ
jgi:hypothetical protein